MRPVYFAARFSDEVLLLHPAILRTLLLEERAGRFVVVEKATRAGLGWSGNEIEQALLNGSLSAIQILADSADWNLCVPRPVGVLYGGEAVIFTRLVSGRVLVICTPPSEFDEVMHTVNDALPTLARASVVSMMSIATPKSAADAAEIARNYVVAVANTSDVSIDEVILLQSKGIWEVNGCHRSTPFARSRRFHLQLNAEDGAVTLFVSQSRSSLVSFVAGICIIASCLVFLIWVLYLASLDR